MASKPIPFWTNFTAGQIDEVLDGRVDLAKYNNGLRRLWDCIPFQQGGVKGRPGTRFVAEAKFAGARVCLIPFSFSVQQNYVLEFGHQYIRIFTNNGQLFSSSGSELVTNGGFTTDLTSWTTEVSDGGIAVEWDEQGAAQGTAKFIRTVTLPPGFPSFATMRQAITTVAGTTYQLEFDVFSGPLWLRIGTSVNGNNVRAEELFQPKVGKQIVSFTALTTTTYVEFFITSRAPTYSHVNNVSLKARGNPIEIVTPYVESNLFNLKYIQSADVLYITHPDHPVKQLNRLSATEWTLTNLRMDPPPTIEAGDSSTTNLALGATSGSGVSGVTADAVWQPADVNRQIISRDGEATIVTVTNSNNIVLNIHNPFHSTTLLAGGWTLTESPKATLSLDIKGPTNATATLTLDIQGWKTPDVGKYVRVWGGVILITGVSSGTVATGRIIVEPTSIAGAIPGSWSLEIAEWSATRKYPRTVGFYDQRLMFAGAPQEPDALVGSRTAQFKNFHRGSNDADAIRYVLSAGQVNVIEWISAQRDLIVGTSGAEYKVSGGLNEPLTPTNILAKPETSWGSESIMPVRADRATIFVQKGGKTLRSISYNFDVDGYVSEDLMLLACSIGSPSMTQISYEKLPIPLVWAVRSDGVLISLVYDPRQEVLAWAEHRTQGRFESVCSITDPTGRKTQTWVSVRREFVEGEPHRYIEYFDQSSIVSEQHPLTGLDSALSYDGTNNLASISITGDYETENEICTVTADSAVFTSADIGKQLRQLTGLGRAIVTAVASLTSMTVKITVPFTDPSLARGEWGLAVKTVSGLDHLEGEEVHIKADGAGENPQTVVDGSITIDGPHALKLDVGLLFEPTLQTLRPGINIPNGNSVFLTKGYNKIYLFFKDTLGATVNDLPIEFRKSVDLMDAAPPLTTAIVDATELGYDSDARITIKQPQPLPFMLLAIAGQLNVGDE